MKFFYQALQRDAGVEVPEEPVEQQLEIQPQSQAAGVATAAAPAPAKSQAAGSVPSVSPVPANTLILPRGLEKLVGGGATSIAAENLMAMEQCRNMRTRLIEMMRVRRLKTVMVTSGVAGEGKTFTSVNLAFALSQIQEIKVLLIGADMRMPSIGEFLGFTPKVGFNNCLLEGLPLFDAAWRVKSNFDLVPSVGFTENSAEILHSKNMVDCMEVARKFYDVVILDAPPLHPIADAQVMTNHVDGALLVVRAHQTPLELVKESSLLLGNKLIATILNGADRSTLSSSYYKNGYRYSNSSKK